MKSSKIIRKFKPDIAIGVGGYASAAAVRVAGNKGVPTLVQEQNSYPGITNRMLAKKAKVICVAYEGLDRFFDKNKIVKTGNPVRSEVVQIKGKREGAFRHFGLNPSKKTVLIIGGSLGARTLNESLHNHISILIEKDIQIIWQCGKTYLDGLKPYVEGLKSKNIYLSDFVYEMDLAYAAADIIVSRAGAMSVSEVCLIGKPAILVPSPNVSEDHQTKNAMALVDVDAAILVKDAEAREKLVARIIDVLEDEELCKSLSQNILSLGITDAPDRILKEIEKIVS